MIASFRAELFKLRRRSAVWLIGAVWMVLTIVFGYLFPYLSYNGTAAGPAGAPTNADQALAQALPAGVVATAVQGFPLFAGALALIIGVLVSGSEYGWQTLKAVLTQGPRRLSVLAGAFVALQLVIVVIVVAAFVTSSAAAAVVAAVTSKPADWPGVADFARGFLGGWLIVGMWAALGMVLGILVRGTALAVGLGLVWTLAVETLLRLFAPSVDLIDTLQRWLPGTNAGALAGAIGVATQGTAGETPGVSTVVSGTHAALVLAGYIVLCAVVGATVLQRRDVV
jgi:ABC-2 type transport system permease protein